MRVQTTFRDFPATEAVEEAVRDQAAVLSQLSDRIILCHVTMAAPRGGTYFHVSIEVEVPGHTIVVTHDTQHGETGESIYQALGAGFHRVRERLAELGDRSRQHRRDLRA